MAFYAASALVFFFNQRRPLSSSCQFLVFLAFAAVAGAEAVLLVGSRWEGSTKQIVVGSGLL